VGEATGDAVAKMLKEIKETSNIGNPYCVPGREVEQSIAELRQRMADMKTSIEILWKPSIEFRDRTLVASDLSIVSSTVTSVSFIGCQSKEWVKIGQRLAALPQVKTLCVEHCDSADDLCGSKWLASLRMGK
jgi:hypothetical protein